MTFVPVSLGDEIQVRYSIDVPPCPIFLVEIGLVAKRMPENQAFPSAN